MMSRRPPRRSKRPSSGRRLPKGPPQELAIRALNRKGEGLAEDLDVTVPFALLGERVMATVSGQLAQVTERSVTSPERQNAPCPHFGWPGDGCGGCLQQHLGVAQSLDHKVSVVRGALERHWPDLPEIQTFQVEPNTRRRAKLAYLKPPRGKGRLGFHTYRSDHVVNMSSCEVLTPKVEACVHALREGFDRLPWDKPPSGPLTLQLTECQEGVDVAIEGMDEASLSLPMREALVSLAEMAGLSRVTIEGVPLLERVQPSQNFGSINLYFPPAAFLQATESAERAMQQFVLRGVPEEGAVADLFCGLGTFAIPLAQRGQRVTAIDSAGASISSLRAAGLRHGLAVEAEARDLFISPLDRDALGAFDGVVIDPPRAGAADQFAQLAGSDVRTIVALSCNPQSFLRDAAVLRDRYEMTDLLVVDQFLWSAHIECGAVFSHRG